MVKGLRLFMEQFDGYQNCFVFIGGTACELLFDSQGLKFRATQDLDLVLFAEGINKAFLDRFWEFIKLGGYRTASQHVKNKNLFRFDKPENSEYPSMIELFSGSDEHPTTLVGSISTLLQHSEEGSNLSGILLDDDYYRFIKNGVVFVDAIPILDAEHLIMLKVKAFLNLTTLNVNGETVKSSDIVKHFKDVFRLTLLLTSDTKIVLSYKMEMEMRSFLDMAEASDISLIDIHPDLTKDDILQQLKHYFLSDF
jgi:hypothetical protein